MCSRFYFVSYYFVDEFVNNILMEKKEDIKTTQNKTNNY